MFFPGMRSALALSVAVQGVVVSNSPSGNIDLADCGHR